MRVVLLGLTTLAVACASNAGVPTCTAGGASNPRPDSYHYFKESWACLVNPIDSVLTVDTTQFQILNMNVPFDPDDATAEDEIADDVLVPAHDAWLTSNVTIDFTYSFLAGGYIGDGDADVLDGLSEITVKDGRLNTTSMNVASAAFIQSYDIPSNGKQIEACDTVIYTKQLDMVTSMEIPIVYDRAIVDPGAAFLLKHVMTHEVGHCLGLADQSIDTAPSATPSLYKGSVMWEELGIDEGATISTADEDALRHLYGT